MAITPQMRTEVAQLYVALFGRAPDGEGLGFWTQLRDQGRSMADIANIMFATQPARTYYPSFLSNQEIISAFYVNVLGRPADAEGLAFWTAKLNGPGATFGSVVSEMVAVVTAYSGTGEPSKSSHDLFVNRVSVAQYYGEHNGTVEGANAVLAGVTKDAATVASMKTAIDNGTVPGVNQGQTFVLTVNQDFGTAFTGGSGNDTFLANAAQDGNGTLVSTLQDVDVLDGGLGRDTLDVTLAGATLSTAPTLRSIEAVKLRFAASGMLDFSNAASVQELVVAGSTDPGAIANIGDLANIAIRDQVEGVYVRGSGSNAAHLNLTFDHFGTRTHAGLLDLGTDNAPKARSASMALNSSWLEIDSAHADALVKAHLAVEGENLLKLTDSRTTLQDVTIEGGGSIRLDYNTFPALRNLDASALGGDLVLDIRTTYDGAAIHTGAGKDRVYIAEAPARSLDVNLGAGDDILIAGNKVLGFTAAEGGAGHDVVQFNDTRDLTAARAAAFHGFEAVDISGASGSVAVAVFDLAILNFAPLQADEAIAGAFLNDVRLDNAPDNMTFTVISQAKTNAGYKLGKSITVNGKDYGGTTANGNAESFTLMAVINDGNNDGATDGAISLPGLRIDGVERLVLDGHVATADVLVPGALGYTVTLNNLVGAQLETIVFKGDAAFELNDGGPKQIGQVALVDGSAASGGFSVTLQDQANAVTVIGSSGADGYISSAHGDTVYMGKGADYVTFTAGGRDTVVLKAAADSQLTDLDKDGKVTLQDEGNDVFDGFSLAENDRIDLTSFGFAGSRAGVVDVTGRVSDTTDLTRFADLFSSVGLDRGVAVAHVNAYTAVFVDVNQDGDFTAADDLVVVFLGLATLPADHISF